MISGHTLTILSRIWKIQRVVVDEVRTRHGYHPPLCRRRIHQLVRRDIVPEIPHGKSRTCRILRIECRQDAADLWIIRCEEQIDAGVGWVGALYSREEHEENAKWYGAGGRKEKKGLDIPGRAGHQ